MGFKSKKWATLKTLNAASVFNVGSGGDPKLSFTFSFGQKILFLTYEQTTPKVPCWCVYDPATDSWDGLYYPSALDDWGWWSGFYGNVVGYRAVGKTLLYGSGQPYGNTGYPGLFSFDEDLNLVDYGDLYGTPAAPGGATSVNYNWFAGTGWSQTDGSPARYLLQTYYIAAVWNWRLYELSRNGALLIDSGDGSAATKTIYLDFVDGTRYWGRPARAYPIWQVGTGESCGVSGQMYLTGVPKDDPGPCSLILGSGCRAMWDNYARWTNDLSQAYATIQPAAGGSSWFAEVGDPYAAVSYPWSTNWEYRRYRDGLSYELLDGDLDGETHSVSGRGIATEPTYNEDLGWYVAFGSDTSLVGDVRVLDPWQPSSISKKSTRAKATMGWVGTWGITPDLSLQNVLELTDPDGTAAMGVCEHDDGLILTSTSMHRRQGGGIIRLADPKIDLSYYPTSDPDWWFPGSDGDHYDGFWEFFLHHNGKPLLGRWLDPDWGWQYPIIGTVANSIGYASSWDYDAAPGEVTHVVRENGRIEGTSGLFSTAMYQYRAMHAGIPGDNTIVVYDYKFTMQHEPWWRAYVGRVDPITGEWETLINFADGQHEPGYGESGGVSYRQPWSVWSVCPIWPGRFLKDGGYLVGATLYFDPWGATWEWDAGSHAATFLSSGKGYVPAIPGWNGPLQQESTLEPRYLTAYDEWTTNRSVYGPDILLVYDYEGNLVTYLNTEAWYPPDGREVLMVQDGTTPYVIYRLYRGGTYSDWAEGLGIYYDAAGGELQTPIYCVYRLNALEPGGGSFAGFVNSTQVADYDLKTAADFPWTALNAAYNSLAPRAAWSTPGRHILRPGFGGLQITPLVPGASRGHHGVRGGATHGR